MARQGLSQGASEGTDIIMQDMGFGVSQRVEKVRLKHAREQQLARTLEEMSAVTRAKVLLALPKENVFARREKKASATVVITPRRGAVISSEEVSSIVDIVASAVQGLQPERVMADCLIQAHKTVKLREARKNLRWSASVKVSTYKKLIRF